MSLHDNICIYKDLATLCKISYNISQTTEYEFDKSEAEIFKYLSQKITHIETKYLNPNPNVLSILSNDSNTIYIVISGSDDVCDFTSDLNIIQKTPKFGKIKDIKFHNGFLNRAYMIFDNILIHIEQFIKNGGSEIYLTGHSSGGSIVSILAYYLHTHNIFNYNNLHVVTFGSPLFVNSIGAKWFNDNIQYHRIELFKDPVPNLSMFIDYEHISKNYILIKKSNMYINTRRSKKISFLHFIKKIFVNVENLHYHLTSTYLEKLSKIKYIYTKN